MREARKQVRATIAAELRPLAKAGTPDHAVGTSKTMRSLARICGAAPSGEGMYAARSPRARDARRPAARDRRR